MTEKYCALMMQAKDSRENTFNPQILKMYSYKGHEENQNNDALPSLNAPQNSYERSKGVNLKAKAQESIVPISNFKKSITGRQSTAAEPGIRKEVDLKLAMEKYKIQKGVSAYAQRPKTRLGRTQDAFRMNRRKKCRRKTNQSTENSIMRTTDKQYDTNEDLLPTATDDDHYNLKTENNPSPIKISINSPEKKSKNLVESIEAKPVQDVKSAIFIQKDEEVKSVREDDQNKSK